MFMQIILIKLTLYLTENAKKKKKNHRLISWQNPVKIKKIPPKNLTILIPYLLQAQPALVLQ